MNRLAIIRPLPATMTGDMVNPERMATDDPKEVAYSANAGAREIEFDLGSPQMVGAIYLGGVTGGTTAFTVTGGPVGYAENALGNLVVAPKRTATGPRQYLMTFAPQLIRYVRLSANLAQGFAVGIARLGELFQPTWGHEWGAGRYLVDTSIVTRNRAGGFGIDKGAIATGWEFTLGDLTDEEREALFDMLRKVGESNPIIVSEDPAVTADLDARLHYGLFQRLEKYERQSVGVTRWSLKVEDWL